MHVKQGATDAHEPAERQRERLHLHAHAGSYTVSVDGLPGYTGAISGDATAKGAVALAENQAKTCTITRTTSRRR